MITLGSDRHFEVASCKAHLPERRLDTGDDAAADQRFSPHPPPTFRRSSSAWQRVPCRTGEV